MPQLLWRAQSPPDSRGRASFTRGSLPVLLRALLRVVLGLAPAFLGACESTSASAPGVVVQVWPEGQTVEVGTGVQLGVLVANTRDTAVSWRSSDAAIASVNSSGLVVGVAPGTALITATARADPTKKAASTITVIPPSAAYVRLEATTYAVAVGEPATFRAVVTARSGRPVPGASVQWSTFYVLGYMSHVDTVWVHPLDPPVTTTDSSGRASVVYTAPVSGWGQRLVTRLENGFAGTAEIVASPPTVSALDAAWSNLAPMPFQRASMAAVAHGGRIFLLGGFCTPGSYSPFDCGPRDASGWVRLVGMVFTPATGQWEQFDVPDSLRLAGFGGMWGGRSENILLGADLPDGIHVIGAGRHLLFEPGTARWTALAPPWPDSLPRLALAAVVQDRLYVVSDAGTLRIYDAAGDRWSDGAPMPRAPGSPGSNGGAAAVLDGRIYVAGGSGIGQIAWSGFFGDGRELTRYDPAANAWSALPPMPYGRSNMGAGVVAGRFCVFGGAVDYWTGSAPFAETYCYDPQRSAWLLGPSRCLASMGMVTVSLGNAVYVFGGASFAYKQGYFTRTSTSLLAPG